MVGLGVRWGTKKEGGGGVVMGYVTSDLPMVPDKISPIGPSNVSAALCHYFSVPKVNHKATNYTPQTHPSIYLALKYSPSIPPLSSATFQLAYRPLSIAQEAVLRSATNMSLPPEFIQVKRLKNKRKADDDNDEGVVDYLRP